MSSALFALLIAAFVLPVSTAAPASAAPADTIHSLVNQARWDSGQRGLIRNPAMDTVALNWAKQMAANSTMAHNPNYSTQIPQGWNKAGENVAQGYPTAQTMHTGWMESPGHKANILGSFTDVGIAFYESGGTTWGVQVFANYAGNTGPAAPVAAQAPAAEEAPAPAPETSATTAPAPTATATPVASGHAEAAPGATLAPSSSSARNSENAETGSPSTLSPSAILASAYSKSSAPSWLITSVFCGILLLGAAAGFAVWRWRTRR
ncbi:CAP domain-containing protein [Salinibacterium sp. M195]|uniref:CAP domain-containing protein n=1 Tax=Salinibacterium sp. M195 TaxID=2583374 RepID=UPI001C6248BC|nr:CAP domain-containing protein [Salinibacterium sp. M195]